MDSIKEFTVTGNPAVFNTNIVKPLKNMLIPFNPIQPSGTPSPDNPLPITGWTGAQVSRTNGKQITDPDYVGQTYSVTWQTEAGTVYGGTVNPISGKLIVDRAYWQITSATNKYEDANGYYWYNSVNSMGNPAIARINAQLICNRLSVKNTIITSSSEGGITFYANGIIRWKEQGALSKTDYNTYLASNPLVICYEMLNPIEYNITPITILPLLGDNTIFSDTNGINTITYLNN